MVISTIIGNETTTRITGFLVLSFSTSSARSPSRRNGRIRRIMHMRLSIGQGIRVTQPAAPNGYPLPNLPSPLAEACSCYANAFGILNIPAKKGVTGTLQACIIWNCKDSTWLHIQEYKYILLHTLQMPLSVSSSSVCNRITEPRL